MYITEVGSGVKKKAIVSKVESKDFKVLTKKRYFFDWESIKDAATFYKLQIENEDNILGVMALIDFPYEKRIEIKLLACSIENQGKNKKHDRVAGCLIGYACNLSTRMYFAAACISLLPKTSLINHYKQKYYMVYGGWQLYLEGIAKKKILNEYFYGL